jgi:hypothetical protein
MSVNVTQSATISISGTNPTAGPGLTLLASPALSVVNSIMGDYFAETFTINPSTTATAIPLGDISIGRTIWVQTDKPISVVLTQSSTDKTYVIDTFLFANASFTALKVANADTVNAAHINVVAAGDRITNPGTPGVF